MCPLFRFRAWAVFLVLAVLTFVLTSFVGAPPFSLSSAVALPTHVFFTAGANLRRVVTEVTDRRDFRAEMEALRERVAELEGEKRQLELELASLTQIREVRLSQSPGVVTTAPVVGADSSPLLSRLVLGKGRAAGVAKDMPVTVPEGLVGVVTGVAEGSAGVRTLLDPESRVGVSVRGRGGQGVAAGEPGGVLRVTGYSEDQPVEVGDVVETSARGGLFPRGIEVGRVTQVLPKVAAGSRLEFLVKPSVNIPNLLEVALIEPR